MFVRESILASDSTVSDDIGLRTLPCHDLVDVPAGEGGDAGVGGVDGQLQVAAAEKGAVADVNLREEGELGEIQDSSNKSWPSWKREL